MLVLRNFYPYISTSSKKYYFHNLFMIKTSFLILLLMLSLGLNAQHTTGLPVIVNYDKAQYQAGTQNWNVLQAANGIVYFANNEGVLSFDGTNWQLFALPNKTIVRSLLIASDNRIYAGGQDEVGFFSPDAQGVLQFTSLKSLIPPSHRAFNDIWQIRQAGDELFFRATDKIFRLSNQVIDVFPAPKEWVFMEVVNGRLLVQDQQEGPLQFSQGTWNRYMAPGMFPQGATITSMTELGGDSMLVTTWKHGLFMLKGQSLFPFTLKTAGLNSSYSSSVRIDEETIALGTNNAGCFVIDKTGNIIQQFSRKSGIQNNSVITLFADRNRNLWLGLENGIDFIAFNNAVRHINPESIGEGTGYAAVVHQNTLYFGLSNGVFRLPLKPIEDLSYSTGSFSLLPKTAGQIWGMSVVNDEVLIGSHEGALRATEKGAEQVSTLAGFWNFLPVENRFPSQTIMGGNYQGIELFRYSNGNLQSAGLISDFRESARFLVHDNENNIWTSHPYRGVYKISEGGKSKSRLFTEKDGLPGTLNNHVYKVRNRVVVATPQGIYEYDKPSDRFVYSEYFRNIFDRLNIRYLREDPSGNIWFISDKKLGVASPSARGMSIIYLPELNDKMVSGFEHIYPYNKSNIFLGAEKGFYHINFDKYKKQNHQLDVLIRSVTASGKSDSLLFGGYHGDVNDTSTQKKLLFPEVPYGFNNFSFAYSSILFEQQSNLEYRYFLEGFDKNWSDWSKRTGKDYTNLPYGNYVFRVQARNNPGNESPETTYSFRILAPWYKSNMAYLAYGMLLAAAIYLLYKSQHKRMIRQQVRHQEEQKRLQYLHQLELEKSEKKIMQLKNEKLEREINFKNSELASTAMHLVQKGEFLSKIKAELVRLNKSPQNQEVVTDLKKLIRNFSEEEKIDEDWEQFAVHFDKFHSDFLVALKEAYPTLTPNELKLCAYLRMNLSSKEIAQLMNISVRGIEISRYRLRKKLKISTETNLFQFLLDFQS